MSNPMELFSPFLATTYNIPEEDDRLKTYLVDRFSSFADVINDKKIGVYSQAAENLNGNKVFYDTTRTTRNGYQTLARINPFPNAGILVLTLTSDPQFPIQDVNPEFVITDMWGTANKPCSSTGAGDGDYFSFMPQGDTRIRFSMSDIQITITTTVDLSAYNGFIFIEYLRNGS